MQQRNAAEVIEMIIDQAAADKTELATLLNVHVPLADLRAQFEGILYDPCFSYLDKEPAVRTFRATIWPGCTRRMRWCLYSGLYKTVKTRVRLIWLINAAAYF
ncbi:hypothetical protein [Paenibacillus sp. HGF7]|uniref:hypothetical protein n=1 Tax=Paenibacillus sp. HGF7 TaxID=944559 RepID=UPI00067FFCE6|nr:hypothetical protein [Paenibacillus sp. HGF7]MBV6712861.1 hypothetical protein [Paenibacillus chitinolyticus]